MLIAALFETENNSTTGKQAKIQEKLQNQKQSKYPLAGNE